MINRDELKRAAALRAIKEMENGMVIGLGTGSTAAFVVEGLALIKGLDGALLREKIVAAASDRLVIVVDQEKLVEQLSEHTPVPVKITPFGWQATAVSLTRLGCAPER